MNQFDFSQKTDGEIAIIIVDLEDAIRQYSQIVQLAREERAKRAQAKLNKAPTGKGEPEVEPKDTAVYS